MIRALESSTPYLQMARCAIMHVLLTSKGNSTEIAAMLVDDLTMNIVSFQFVFVISPESFGDLMCIEIKLVHKTSIKPCGFGSVYCESQQ